MNKLLTIHAAMMQVDGLISLTERKLRTLYELRLSLHHRLLMADAGTPCEDDAPCERCGDAQHAAQFQKAAAKARVTAVKR